MGPIETRLRKALAIYKERGGAVGTFQDSRGNVCALGASGLALDGTPAGYDSDDEDILSEVSQDLDGAWVDDFNDAHPGLPVRNLFRRAIGLAMERGR